MKAQPLSMMLNCCATAGAWLSINRIWYATLLLKTVLLAVSFGVRAQTEIKPEGTALANEAPTLRFEPLGIAEGLSQGSGNAIMQDKKGFIWISTQGGLHRWDGQEFKVFSSTPFDTTSLSDTWVWSATEASDGDLWVATAEAGLNKLDPETGKAKHYRHDPGDSTSISADFTFYTLEATNGDLWVSTLGAGLNRMRKGEDGIFTRFQHNPDDPGTISSNSVYWLTEDADGYIWAGGNNGINRIDPETEVITKFLDDPNRNPRYGDPVNVLGQYIPPGNRGMMWLATGAGLVRFSSSTGEYQRFLIEDTKEPSQLNFIHEVKPDPSDPNILWVAGPGTGVARFDMRTEEFTSYRNDPKDGNSLQSNIAVSLFLDRTGMMWVGTATEGVNIFNPGAVNFRHIKHDTENPQSLAPGSVWGVHEDSEGSLWVGTDVGANRNFLTHFDANSGEIKRYQHDPTNPQSLQLGNLRTFATDAMGRFWVAGQGGLSIFGRQSGKVKRIARTPEEIQKGLRSVFAVIVDQSDANIFWVGGGGGLERFNTITEEFSTILLYPDSSQLEPGVLSLMQDSEGIVWAGTSDGLFRVDFSSGEVELASTYTPDDTTTISSNSIRCITEREQEPGVLWLAAGNAGGLNRYDTKTGIATHYFKEDGLAENTVYGILTDQNGGLWVSTNGGISNFDPESNEFRNYGLDDGLMALEYNQNGYSQGNSGLLYFGSGKGVTAFEPEYLNTNSIPPQVTFTDFKLFNKSLEPGPDSPLKESPTNGSKVNLNHDENEIEIDFVALHYSNPKQNQYRYKLEGFDADWVDAGTKRSAAYTNLPPGNFTFRVIASNADGVWNEEGASLQISILPPWYRTWGAYIGFAIVLGLLVFGVDRIQRSRISRKEEERAALREAELRAEAENKRRSDTEELSKIGRAITSSLSVDKIIETVYENVNALMDATIFGVGIYNKEKKCLDFPATKEEGVMLSPYSNHLDEEQWLSVWCFTNKEEIVISDFNKEYSRYLKSYSPPLEGKSPVSVLYMPLMQQGRAVGVITTQSFTEGAYSEYHVNLLRNLANYAAIALDNASAYRRLDATLKDLRSTQQQLVQSEKMASLGELTAGIAHEIQNPLNFVNNFSDVNTELIEELKEAIQKGDLKEVEEIANDLKENEEKIVHHGKRAEEIVRSMLQHSRGSEGKKEPTNINTLADEYLRLAFHGMRAKDKSFNVEMKTDFDDSIKDIQVVPQDIGRVLLNLITNAFHTVAERKDANEEDYKPAVGIKTKMVGKSVEIKVSDNGRGIPKDIRDKIFQPFYSTKGTGKGTGLGLSLSYDIITKGHNGEISVDSKEGEGTTFSILIPI